MQPSVLIQPKKGLGQVPKKRIIEGPLRWRYVAVAKENKRLKKDLEALNDDAFWAEMALVSNSVIHH